MACATKVALRSALYEEAVFGQREISWLVVGSVYIGGQSKLYWFLDVGVPPWGVKGNGLHFHAIIPYP